MTWIHGDRAAERDNQLRYGLGTEPTPEGSMSRNYERPRVDERWADSRKRFMAKRMGAKTIEVKASH